AMLSSCAMQVMQDRSRSKKKLDGKALRNLDIEIGFLEGLVQRAPEYLEALQILGDDYARRGRIDDGLAVDRRLVTLCPQDPVAYYNLGCNYSLTGQHDAALTALEQALNLGYADFPWI